MTVMRAKFENDICSVRLTAVDPFTAEPIDETFWIGAGKDVLRWKSDGEICYGGLFGKRGSSIPCSQEELLATVRQYWAVYRRAAKRSSRAEQS